MAHSPKRVSRNEEHRQLREQVEALLERRGALQAEITARVCENGRYIRGSECYLDWQSNQEHGAKKPPTRTLTVYQLYDRRRPIYDAVQELVLATEKLAVWLDSARSLKEEFIPYGPETGSREVKIEVRDRVRWSELETQRGGQAE